MNGSTQARHAHIAVNSGRGVTFRRARLWRTVAQEEPLPVPVAGIEAIAADGRAESDR